MFDLVVARYNEPLDWLAPFESQPDFRIFVYNKGEPYTNPRATVIDRPNIGREAETYLYHILHTYDTLSPYTIFLQGKPFDHIVYPLNPETLRNLARPCFILDTRSVVMLNNRHVEGHNVYDTLTKEYSEALFVSPPPVFEFSPGAQYIVSRSALQHRPRFVYQTFLDMISKHLENNRLIASFRPDAIDAWNIERFWTYIWSDRELKALYSTPTHFQ